MPGHPFLSPEWIAAARLIHDDYKDQVAAPPESLRMNVTIIDAPYADAVVLGHVDTTAGSIVPNEGHLADPDVHVRLPYELARRLFFERAVDVLMISFMSGEIEVEGDVTRLLALQDLTVSDAERVLLAEVAGRLDAITS